MAQDQASFSPELFAFLRELREQNDRDWFKANKQRFDEAVQEPALEFIADFAPHLHEISPHFVADARPVGGSLFRIYRDTRFSKDKTPYKTHTGMHFRHDQGKDVHAPGYYLHLEPGRVFAAAGVWRPDTATLDAIRTAIADAPDRWREALRDGRTGEPLTLEGETLKRAPAGYDPAHPLIEDLKRKDFVTSASLSEEVVCSPGLAPAVADTFRSFTPLVRLLCGAGGVPF